MCTCVDTPSPAAFHFISCTFHSQRRYRQCHLKSTKRLKSCLVLGKHEAKILCSSMCKCVGCKNFEDSSERKTLMQLADAAEVRVQQQAAARTKMSACDLPMRPAPVSDSC
ncbi:protein lin-54 homolog isoform X2 [Amblyomma americanum]